MRAISDALVPRRGRLTAPLSMLLMLLLWGCSSPPPEAEKGPTSDACLKGVDLDQLNRSIQGCDAVVSSHPDDPRPRNERALLYSLAGRNREACRDSLMAAQLLERQPRRPAPDPLLVEEIQLRRDSCRRLTSPPTAAAPSGGMPPAAKQ